MGCPPNWLEEYLVEAVRKNLCTRIGCGTCGAMEFRRGALNGLTNATGQGSHGRFDREAILAMARALAEVGPTTRDLAELEPAARCILYDLWSAMPALDQEIEASLAGSWAGSVLHRMKLHHAAREAVHRAEMERQDPAKIQERREEKKRIKQERHELHLARKKERDRLWHEKNTKTD